MPGAGQVNKADMFSGRCRDKLSRVTLGRDVDDGGQSCMTLRERAQHVQIRGALCVVMIEGGRLASIVVSGETCRCARLPCCTCYASILRAQLEQDCKMGDGRMMFGYARYLAAKNLGASV